MANTRSLTDKPVEREVVTEDGKTVAAHLTDVVTDPEAENAVQVPSATEYPTANATELDALAAHGQGSPADGLDPDEGAGTNEVQTLTEVGTITAGTYTITWEGDTTDALNFDDTAAEIKTALTEGTSLGEDDVTVTGGPVHTAPVVVTFVGGQAATDVSALTVSSTNLTGGTVSVTETTKGVHADAP